MSEAETGVAGPSLAPEGPYDASTRTSTRHESEIDARSPHEAAVLIESSAKTSRHVQIGVSASALSAQNLTRRRQGRTARQQRLPEAGIYLPSDVDALLDSEGFPISSGVSPEQILASDPRGQQLLNLLRAQTELSEDVVLSSGKRTFRTRRRRSSVGTAAVNGDLDHGLNLIETFRLMQFRKMERQRTGKYKSSNTTKIFWMSFTVIIFLALLGLVGVSFTGGPGLNVVNLLLVAFVFPVIFFFVIKITLVYRLVFYIFLCGVLCYVSITLAFVYQPPPDYVSSPTSNPDYIRAVAITGGVTAGLMLLSFLGYLYARRVYPLLVRKMTIGSPQDAIRWWRIRPLKDAYISPSGNWAWAKYMYEAWETTKWGNRTLTFSYRGGVGVDGQPHGWGEWKDSAFSGECLTGFWEDGVPVGPFRSRETGTGNAFKSIRVGFVSCANKPWEDPTFAPELHPNGLSWGFATVECSVAGSFFSNLPLATAVIEPTFMADVPDIVDDVLEGMAAGTLSLKNEAGKRAVVDSSAIAPPASLRPTGTEMSDMVFRNQRIPLNMVPSAIEDQEVLVFIPGFNSNSKWAMRVLAQLLTYAEFPDRIKPFVFSWPGGRELSFFQAKAMAMSPATHELFLQALKELAKRSRGIHIFAHSQGPRIPLGIADRLGEVFWDIDEIRDGAHEDSTEDSGPTKARLLSFTLLNSESPVKPFVTHQFQAYRRYTDMVTVYTDQEDGALDLAEWFTRLNYFEPKEPDYRALGYTTGGLYHKVTTETAVSLGPTELDLESGRGPAVAASPTAPFSKSATELQVLGGGDTGIGRVSWGGATTSRPGDAAKVQKRWLDLDVVDTTLLKVNVQALRHAYFSLQRSLVDDLFDIICRGLRARDRERLLHVNENLYGFLVAPPYMEGVGE